MINRVTGEITFQSGLRIVAHGTVMSAIADLEAGRKIRTLKLSLAGWKGHVFGFHPSEHGTFEVEAFSAEEERIQLVMLAHRHAFYLADTLEDADRRAFHEGVIDTDLGGQREFSWGEVICRLEKAANKSWLVVAYSRDAKVPLPTREALLHLYAHEDLPGKDD